MHRLKSFSRNVSELISKLVVRFGRKMFINVKEIKFIYLIKRFF